MKQIGSVAFTAHQSPKASVRRKATSVEHDHVPLTVALIAATLLFYGARIFQYQGYAWADDVCMTAPALCASPHWLGFVAMAAMVYYLFTQAAKQ